MPFVIFGIFSRGQHNCSSSSQLVYCIGESMMMMLSITDVLTNFGGKRR